jgi:nucleotide-binding universal stress UspA family protein
MRAPLRALFVAEAGTKRGPLRRRLEDMLARLPPGLARACRPSAEVFSGKPTEVILEAGIAAGLIVLVAHRKTLLGDLILGTTVERVLRHSPAPVIAVPGPPR